MKKTYPKVRLQRVQHTRSQLSRSQSLGLPPVQSLGIGDTVAAVHAWDGDDFGLRLS